MNAEETEEYNNLIQAALAVSATKERGGKLLEQKKADAAIAQLHKSHNVKFDVCEISKPSGIPTKPVDIPIDNINLCFVGGVSTGKSTILNAIFCEQLTQCKIKRTTMFPTIYIENDNDSDNLTSPESIYETISIKNKDIIEKTETGQKCETDDYNEMILILEN